ncbi:MAG TPA: class I SAM-dependent methyltransferase, partial [Chitinophagaceae bacterium]|nr:class I SAM-dependent methyltransferase [Chitinophagaceae bacterium]
MTFKPHISSLLRKTGLLSLAERARYSLEKIKYGGINRRFLKSHPKVVFPPPYYIYETYKLRYDEYWLDGLETAKEIIDKFQSQPGWPRGPVKILDWGCGPGRVVRHMPSLLPPGSAVFGADYNEVYIKWCKRNLKAIQFFRASLAPPLKFEPSFFDGVFGISVFTHLSKANHFAWVNELHRIVRPGAFVFLTTQGKAFLNKLSAKEKESFLQGQPIFRETTKEGSRLYSSFQPASFIEEIMMGKFEVLDYQPGAGMKDPSQDE